jgi:hypothetical protein
VASNVVEIVLKAKDEASTQVKKLANEVGGLAKTAASVASAAGAFGQLAAAALVAGTAIVALGKSFTEQVTALDRAAKSVGTSRENIQVLQEAFEKFGLAPEAATKALIFLNRAIGRNAPELQQLGIKTKDAYSAFVQLSDIFDRSSDTGKKQYLALKLLGKSAGDLVGAMGDINHALPETRRLMEENNVIIGDKSAAAAGKMRDALEEMNLRWKGVWKTLKEQLLPVALSTLAWLSKILTLVTQIAQFPPVKLTFELVWKGLDPSTIIKDIAILKETFSHFSDRSFRENVANATGVAGIAHLSPMGSEQLMPGHAATGAAKPSGMFASHGTPQGGGSNPLANVKIGATVIGFDEDGNPIFSEGNAAKEKKRILDIAEVREAIRGTIAQADILLDKEDKLAHAEKVEKRRQDLVDKGLISDITKPGALTGSDFLQKGKLKGTELAVSPLVDTKKLDEQMKAFIKTLHAESEAVTDVKLKWREWVDYAASTAGILDDVFSTLLGGIENAFSSAFASIGQKGTTLRSLLKGIFQSVTQEILAMLGRLVAHQIFKFVFGLLFGPSKLAASVLTLPWTGSGLPGSPSLAPAESLRSALAPPPTFLSVPRPPSPEAQGQARAARLAPTSSVTVNISAFDVRSVYGALVAPRGELRQALTRQMLAVETV